MLPRYNYLSTAVACLVTAFVLAACGGNSNNSGAAATASGVSGQSQSSQAGLAKAKAALREYVGHPSPFPVTEPLKRRPVGATVVFPSCGTPYCGVIWQLLQPAAKAMGLKLTQVEAGSSANTVSAAFDSIVRLHPKGVIVSGINFELWAKQLKELEKAGTRVVTTGITGSEQVGLGSQQGGSSFAEVSGRLLADYVAVKLGSKADVAFYGVPELPFSPLLQSAFNTQIKQACPGCKVRYVAIPEATIGNTAPATIVSDLQTHPGTTVAVFASDEAEAGVPAALRAAGISVKTLGSAPTPTELEYLKHGQEWASLGYDAPVSAWTMVDEIAREITGQKVTGLEKQGSGVQQFLTKSDITFDPSHGWTGYPDFAQRFAKLWGVKG